VAICAIFVYATMEHEEQKLLILHLSLPTPCWNMKNNNYYYYYYIYPCPHHAGTWTTTTTTTSIPVHTMLEYVRSKDIYQHILNLRCTEICLVRFTSQTRFPFESTPVPIKHEAGWVAARSWIL